MGNLKTVLSLLLLSLVMTVRFILSVLADGTTPKQITGERFLGVEDGDTVMQCEGPGPACPQMPLSGADAVPPCSLRWRARTLQAPPPGLLQLASS